MAMMQTLKASFVLCWKKDTNWASAWVYLPFAFLRPLSGALLILVMSKAAGAGPEYYAPAFFGNALFQFVPALLAGLSMTVIEDRERFQMFKYICLAPSGVVTYLAGHGLSRALLASISVASLLLGGALLLDIRPDPASFRPALLAAAFLLGFTSLLFLGLLIGGVSLLVARHGHFMTESVSGVFFLFSGAVFPIDILPAWMRPLAYASPVTYWLELCRRAMGMTYGKLLSRHSDLTLLAILAGLTVVCILAGKLGYAACERRARWRGLLDTTTGY